MGKKVESMKEPETKLEEAWQQDHEVKRRFLRGWEQCPTTRELKRPTESVPSTVAGTHGSGCYFYWVSWLKAPAWKNRKICCWFYQKGLQANSGSRHRKPQWCNESRILIFLTGGHNGVPVLQVTQRPRRAGGGVAACCGPNCTSLPTESRQDNDGSGQGGAVGGLRGNHLL